MMHAEDAPEADVLHQIELEDQSMIDGREVSSAESNELIQTREESENNEQEREGVEYEQEQERKEDNPSIEKNKRSNFYSNLIKTILFCYAFISKYYGHVLCAHFKPVNIG